MALTDHRLVGETAENIFLSLLNSRGVFLEVFKSSTQYRFSVTRCQEAMSTDNSIFML
jgi:hypothetical protein